LDRRSVAATIPVGRSPSLARVSPDGSTVVVANRADNSVSIIDTERLAVRSAIAICIHPEDIAILPDSTKAFISCSGSGQIASIGLKNGPKDNDVKNDDLKLDASKSDKLLALLDVGKSPVSLALKPDGGELVAFNFDAGSISIIETTGNEVSGSYLVGAQPTRGVVSLDNSRLYISNFGSNNIAVYDIDLGKVIAYLPVGTHPDALALSRSQDYLLVADSGSGDLAIIQKRTPKKKFEPLEYSLLTIIPVGMQPNQIVVKSFWATKLANSR
ncbi:MAG: YncE family protein, partial [Terriglobales bacterium]